MWLSHAVFFLSFCLAAPFVSLLHSLAHCFIRRIRLSFQQHRCLSSLLLSTILFVRSFVQSFVFVLLLMLSKFCVLCVFLSVLLTVYLTHTLALALEIFRCISLAACSSELSASIMCRGFVSSVFNADEYRRYVSN